MNEADEMTNEPGSLFQCQLSRRTSKERAGMSVIARVTTDEEQLLNGTEQRSSCADRYVVNSKRLFFYRPR